MPRLESILAATFSLLVSCANEKQESHREYTANKIEVYQVPVNEVTPQDIPSWQKPDFQAYQVPTGSIKPEDIPPWQRQ